MSEGKSIIGKVLVVVAIVGCLYGAYYFLFKKGSSNEPDAPSMRVSSCQLQSSIKAAV